MPGFFLSACFFWGRGPASSNGMEVWKGNREELLRKQRCLKPRDPSRQGYMDSIDNKSWSSGSRVAKEQYIWYIFNIPGGLERCHCSLQYYHVVIDPQRTWNLSEVQVEHGVKTRRFCFCVALYLLNIIDCTPHVAPKYETSFDCTANSKQKIVRRSHEKEYIIPPK